MSPLNVTAFTIAKDKIMRLNRNESINLINDSDLLKLGKMADDIRRNKFGNVTTFIIDRNIN